MTPPQAPDPGDAGAASSAARADWTQRPERSNTATLRLMAWLAVHGGRRLARALLVPITLYYLAFGPRVARQSRRFLARALGRPATLRDRYRHLHSFAATLLDRIYFLREGAARFQVDLQGQAAIHDAAQNDPGVFLVGAHLGSFEALRMVGDRLGHLKVAMVMYPGNAQKVNRTLDAIAPPDARPHIIELGQLGAMLSVRDWLDQGGLAGMLGDRTLGTDPHPAHTLHLPFLGVDAPFSDGPMRLAALLRRRVFFMVALYHGGAHYDVRFVPLADFRHLGHGERDARVAEAVRAYAHTLEALAREAPSNWFNFHDFWHEDP